MTPEERAVDILARYLSPPPGIYLGIEHDIAANIRQAVAFAQEHSQVPLLMKGMESQSELMDGLKQENRTLKAIRDSYAKIRGILMDWHSGRMTAERAIVEIDELATIRDG